MPVTPASTIEQPRPDLAEGLEQFDLRANQAGFVGLRIFPTIEVATAFGKYKVSRLKDMLKRRKNTKRQADGTYGRVETEFDQASYATEEYGQESRVDESDAARYGAWVDAEFIAAELARDAVLQDLENRLLTLAFSNAVHATDISTPWVTSASCTPVTDITTARILIRNRSGVIPNCLCIEWEIFQRVRHSTQVMETLGSQGIIETDPQKISPAMLARVFDLDEVIVAGAMENTANEAKDASLQAMWPTDKGLLFHRSNDKNLKKPRFGNTFHWGFDGSQIGGLMESYYSMERRSDVVRCRLEVDEVLMYAACGEVLTGLAT